MTDNANLTPTAQAILEALGAGPATSAELRERTSRGRSTIDRALAELASTGYVTKTPIEGGPVQWAVPDAAAEPRTEPEAEPATEDPPEPDPDTGGGQPDPGTTDDGDSVPDEQVKQCRGCGEQMPRICPTCSAKTTGYCGTCRATRATRSASGEPQILSSGLRKLARGELERLVAGVIRTHPLPDHLGITGWTPARVAIYLPGRSPGAIANALDKLAATGQAQLLGTDPKRYQPVPSHDEPDGEPCEQSDDAQRSGAEIVPEP